MIRVGAVFWHDIGGGKRRPCIVLDAERDAEYALVVYGTTVHRPHIDSVTVEGGTRFAQRMGLRSTTRFEGGMRAVRWVAFSEIVWEGKHTAPPSLLVELRKIVDDAF